jgi:hypothetical protein
MKCHVDGRGGLHVEAATVRMHRLIGRRDERAHRICANHNGSGPCRTLILHKFSVECRGGSADWNDIVAGLIADRVMGARVRAERLSFRLAGSSFASLNVLCDAGGRASVDRFDAERHWQLDATCRDFGFVPRRWVELPAGFAPLSEVGGRLLVNVAQSDVAPPPLPVPNRNSWPDAMHAGIAPEDNRVTQDAAHPRPDQAVTPAHVTASRPDALLASRKPQHGFDRPPETTRRTSPAASPTSPDRGSDDPVSPPTVPAGSWRLTQNVAPPVPTNAGVSSDQSTRGGTSAYAPPVERPARTEDRRSVDATLMPGALPTAVPARTVTQPVLIAAGTTPTASTAGASPVTLNSWNTLVEVIKAGTGDGSSGEVRRTAQQSIITTMMSLMLLTSLVFSGIGLFAGRQLWSVPNIRSADPYQVMLRREVADLTRPDAQMCTELCRSAQGLVEQINASVTELNGVAPLRRVLLREVRNMEKFLSATMHERPADTSGWRRMRYRLQRVVTDLLRLKDITEGARRSLTTVVVAKDLPRDKYEAYEVLGANADTSEPILKRLVDALRATWHPDHAVNEDDRLVREDRIKQINVAWDLIQEKRVEA